MDLLFDFRPVQGESSFIFELKKTLQKAIGDNPKFLMNLALAGAGYRPPLGFLRHFVVEKDGQYREVLNLCQLLQPVINGARVLAWEHDITETNTLSRLAELAKLNLISTRTANNLREAFSFITSLRINQYLKKTNEREDHSFDLVNPVDLNGVQRRNLKESFAEVSAFQDFVIKRYVK